MSTANANVYTDFEGLAQLKTQARNNSPEALREVAKQFESIFLNMVLKSMRDAKLSDGILDSSQSEFFQEMYDQQLALHLSGDPGVGLADMIVRQLSPTAHNPALGKHALSDYLKNPVSASQSGKNNDSAGSKNTQPTAQKALTPLKLEISQPITSTTEFVKQLSAHAQQAAKQLGVDPGVLIAQAALETGWGQSIIHNEDGQSSHNLFNIKADKSWRGEQTSIVTTEYEQGVATKQVAGFRVYNSFKESFQDYVNFIKANPRYSEALQQVRNPQRYMQALQQAGYATDPSYADKVMKIYHNQVLESSPSPKIALNTRP